MFKTPCFGQFKRSKTTAMAVIRPVLVPLGLWLALHRPPQQNEPKDVDDVDPCSGCSLQMSLTKPLGCAAPGDFKPKFKLIYSRPIIMKAPDTLSCVCCLAANHRTAKCGWTQSVMLNHWSLQTSFWVHWSRKWFGKLILDSGNIPPARPGADHFFLLAATRLYNLPSAPQPLRDVTGQSWIMRSSWLLKTKWKNAWSPKLDCEGQQCLQKLGAEGCPIPQWDEMQEQRI